jgi:phospholipid N-methyltransferase
MGYIREFIRDKKVATIAPSSQRTISRVCRNIDFSKDLTLVEYGPGTGCITKEILSKMSTQSTLTVFETNAAFVSRLKQLDDPRLLVIHDDASNAPQVLKQKSVDYVISGIPFSFIDPASQELLIHRTRALLGKEGTFLAYQASPKLRKRLSMHFQQVRTRFQPLNLPPLWVFEARNPLAGTSHGKNI